MLVAELKKDKEGYKEYEDYLKTMEMKKKDLQKRVNANKTWIVSSRAGEQITIVCTCAIFQIMACDDALRWCPFAAGISVNSPMIVHCMYTQQNELGVWRSSDAYFCAYNGKFSLFLSWQLSLWCFQENFEKNDDVGAFEAQYKKLLDQIQQIYNSAKDGHAKVGTVS